MRLGVLHTQRSELSFRHWISSLLTNQCFMLCYGVWYAVCSAVLCRALFCTMCILIAIIVYAILFSNMMVVCFKFRCQLINIFEMKPHILWMKSEMEKNQNERMKKKKNTHTEQNTIKLNLIQVNHKSRQIEMFNKHMQTVVLFVSIRFVHFFVFAIFFRGRGSFKTTLRIVVLFSKLSSSFFTDTITILIIKYENTYAN